MKRKNFNWLTDELILDCRSTQLREKTMSSDEQSLRRFDYHTAQCPVPVLPTAAGFFT